MSALTRCMAVIALMAVPTAGLAQDPADEGFHPWAWLVVEKVDVRGRRPFNPDAVFAKHLLDPTAPAPKAGEKISGDTGRAAVWKSVRAKPGGAVEADGIGYAYAELRHDTGGVFLADLRGASTLFVNGDGFVGDVYRYGFRGVPVELRKGVNHLYVRGVRGTFRLSFRPPPTRLVIADWDLTVPDLIRERPTQTGGSVLVLNATTEPVTGAMIVSGGKGAFAESRPSSGESIPPLGMSKLRFGVFENRKGGLDPSVKERTLPVSAVVDFADAPTTGSVTLKVRSREGPYLGAFTSSIDGTVQIYGELRPAGDPGKEKDVSLVVSLHGASVKPRNQISSYSKKEGYWLVAPTNRRPFGFDWQDWGRLDAYEVVDHVLKQTGLPTGRVFLTGHSMGGHGTWHLAANDADRFAAIAPSAGWATFGSYTGRPLGMLTALWRSADLQSDTLGLLDNLVQIPTFVLHGEKDDNVPASEARNLIAKLEEKGGKPLSHFEPDKKHWWDGDRAGGADCVDWPGIFELFDSVPEEQDLTKLDFTTVDPVIDSRHHWIRVTQPMVYGKPVRVRASWDAAIGIVTVTTENARRILVEAPPGASPNGYSIDSADFLVSKGKPWFRRNDKGWVAGLDGQAQLRKSPKRSGPFKRVFDNGFVFVIPTAGSDAENAEALARARYDASGWWYRGNGNAPIFTDRAFLAGDRMKKRNVILYGNGDTNRAWGDVFGDACPVKVRRGRLKIGRRTYEGDSLGCVFVFPRADSKQSMAGAFADTGVAGARLGYSLLTWVSGAGFPDYLAYGPGILTFGDGGTVAAGWFDHRWRLDGRGFRGIGSTVDEDR